MPFADDAEYQQARREAEMKAVERLKACFGRRLDQPRTDGEGRTWIGFGRNLFRRRQSQAAADLDLSEDVAATYQVLERRLLQMTFNSPTTLLKVPSLVVIADLIGPEAIRDCEPLWVAIAAKGRRHPPRIRLARVPRCRPALAGSGGNQHADHRAVDGWPAVNRAHIAVALGIALFAGGGRSRLGMAERSRGGRGSTAAGCSSRAGLDR